MRMKNLLFIVPLLFLSLALTSCTSEVVDVLDAIDWPGLFAGIGVGYRFKRSK